MKSDRASIVRKLSARCNSSSERIEAQRLIDSRSRKTGINKMRSASVSAASSLAVASNSSLTRSLSFNAIYRIRSRTQVWYQLDHQLKDNEFQSIDLERMPADKANGIR